MTQEDIDPKTSTQKTEVALTPAMRQYRTAKETYPDTLLFFRMGDFYELFFDDAVIASRELQLTLTARDKARSIPMCGVPYHAAESYVHRLLRRGYRVGICEQMEDPKFAKGVLKREVTRVLTPGTAIDPGLDSGESCWLAATGQQRGAEILGLAFVDLSTGEFRTTEFKGPDRWQQAIDELGRMHPVELLYSSDLFALSPGSARTTIVQLQMLEADHEASKSLFSGLEAIRTKTPVEPWTFLPELAIASLQQHLRLHSLDGLGLSNHPAACGAAGALLEYLKQTKQGALDHIDTLRFQERSTCLALDAVTVRNLEITDPLFAGEGAQTTLLWTLDACQTPMGRRMLRSTLLRPAYDLREITERLDAVSEAVSNLRLREELRRSLDGVLDLERLLSRISLDSAGPRELLALARTMARLPAVRGSAQTFHAERWNDLAKSLDSLEDIASQIFATISDEPPNSLADPGAIRAGFNQELDQLRDLGQNGRQAIAAIEERERTRTGIGSLKVRFNNIFGFFIEVTRANAHAVPKDYERKQTLVNAERFTTPELKDLEEKILHAQDRCLEIERKLFGELRAAILACSKRVRQSARAVAEIDLTTTYAHLAALRGWIRPVVDESGVLEIVGGRHPVVERRMEEQGVGRFVPNSLFLQAQVDHSERDRGPSVALITGPNMGGKSTYLRMAALLVIMAQTGSFVPAESLRVGLTDRVFTRIGASDNVARGRSTFMVEMTETAAILHTATARSLILLDEMGRGTATYDGLSLAWATVEHLHDSVRARALFATHYHELTLLSERLTRLTNLRVTVKESGGGIVFLHTVEAGSASKSYGIEVARLAGLPRAVIDRAREVLRVHERTETAQMREATARGVADGGTKLQMTMFAPLSQKIVDRVGAVDVNEMTPREALNLLAELQHELRG